MRRKLTIAELSVRSCVSTRELRRLVRGEVQPNDETVSAIATALRYPIGFFFSGELEVPQEATFRARSSMTKKEAGAGLASAALGARLSHWLETEFSVPNSDVPDLSDLPPEVAAQTLREMWGLGTRPLGNMVRLLEAKGVRVFSLSEETIRLDAFATWIDTRPFIFLNGVKSSERSRFDAAHELGHLCLHRDNQQGKNIEDEANAFASAFLMPAGEVLARRVSPTIMNLIAAKAHWGVALSALVHRYRDLRLVSDERARWLYIEMSRKGYLKSEPMPMVKEGSFIWMQVIQTLWQERKSVSHIADELMLPLDEVEALIFVNRKMSSADLAKKARDSSHSLKLVS